MNILAIFKNTLRIYGLYSVIQNKTRIIFNIIMEFAQRLKKYIDYKGISLNAFDQSIGTSNGYIGRAIKGNSSLGSDILQNIFSEYTDLNPTWLLTGKEEMLFNNNKQSYQQDEIVHIASEPDMPFHHLPTSIDDERKTLIASINKMTDTADRNSRTLEKIVDYLVSKDINIE